jgi:hypothetical protein
MRVGEPTTLYRGDRILSISSKTERSYVSEFSTYRSGSLGAFGLVALASSNDEIGNSSQQLTPTSHAWHN